MSQFSGCFRHTMLALGVVGLCLQVACSDSTTGAKATPVDPGLKLGLKPGELKGLNGVETKLSADAAAAGTDVVVTCLGQPGDLIIPTPTYTVTPSADVAMAGATITPHKAGLYSVACSLPNAAKTTDSTPAQLLISAGKAVTISTKVEPAQIAAGETALATCAGTDAFGNAAATGEGAGWTITIDPPETADIAELKLTGKKAGKGTVKCVHAGSPEANVGTATLTVIAGKAVTTQATAVPAKFEAGAGSSTISCAAVDVAGNAVQVDPAQFTLDVPAGLTLAGTAVSGNKSGKFDIKCGLTGVTAQTPASIEVTPGAPVSMTLVAKPKQPVYKPEETIKLSGLGKDKFDNDVPDLPLNVAAIDPPDEVTINGGGKSYSFQQDGVYKFTATATDHAQLTASLTLKVDSTGPLVLITDPKRGDTREGNAKVTVKGTCLDELSATKSFLINKKPIKIGADGSFTFEIDSQLGMNAIVWEAADEWDNPSNGVQAYYYSTKWYPQDPAKPEKSAVKSGIGVWMSQSTLDAGPPHNHKTPKDLASVAEIVIGSMDIKSLLGAGGIPINQGLLGMTINDIKIIDFKLGDPAINDGYPDVAITVIKGGLGLKSKLYKLDTTMRMNVTTFGIVGYQEFVIKADWITLDTDLYISLDPVSGKPVSEAKKTTLKIAKLDIKLGGNSLPPPLDSLVKAGGNGLISFLDTFLNSTFTGLLEGIMQDQIQKMLGDVLGSALEALAINMDLPLKPFIGAGAEVKLKLATKLGLLDFVPKGAEPGGMLIGLDGSVTAPKNVDHPVLGSLGNAGCLDPGAKVKFNPTLKFALEMGLADDFINELLFSVWNGGLLNLAIGADALGSVDLSQYGVADVNITTDFLLPPLVNACVDNNGDLKLQVGDLLLHAQLSFSGIPVDVYIYVTLQATAALSAVDNPKTGMKELGFALKGIDYVELEVVKINAEAKGLKDLFVTMIKKVMIPKLVESLGSGLGSFPLPAFDLSGFSPSIPKGTAIALDIQQIENKQGYTYLRGKVK